MILKEALGNKKPAIEETLQSIDGTLKHIEAILLNEKKNCEVDVRRALQDVVEVSISQNQGHPSVLSLKIPDLLLLLERTDSQTES